MLETNESALPQPMGVKTGSQPDLYPGLYLMVAPSSAGKTLCGLCISIEEENRVAFLAVNESHGRLVPISWLADALGLSLYAALPRANQETVTFPKDSNIVVVDSFTYFCWTAERLEETFTSSKQEQEGQLITGNQMAMRRSAAKTGGVTGELQEFLLAIDRACVRKKLTMVATVNSDQYPIGGRHTSVYALFKGVVTGVMTPQMIKGGASGVLISDRANRDEWLYTFKPETVNSAAGILGYQTAVEQKERVPAKLVYGRL